jgi:NUMOD3 motif-containing protein/GIY-YIG catalytic domain-containing protein
MPYGIIYLATNTVNGKRYVGQTVRSLEERWIEHCKPSPTNFHAINAAIQKYGKENFTIEKLVEADSLDQLNKDEDFYILLLGTLGSHSGYNSRLGGSLGRMTEEVKRKIGNANRGKKRTLEQCARIGASRIGVPSPKSHVRSDKGCKRTPETCQKIREALQGNKNCLGVKHSEETRHKMSLAATEREKKKREARLSG